jgi:hypothetical protein
MTEFEGMEAIIVSQLRIDFPKRNRSRWSRRSCRYLIAHLRDGRRTGTW